MQGLVIINNFISYNHCNLLSIILYKSYDMIYTNNWFNHVYNYYYNVGYTKYVSNPLDNTVDEEVLNIIYQIRKINPNGNKKDSE